MGMEIASVGDKPVLCVVAFLAGDAVSDSVNNPVYSWFHWLRLSYLGSAAIIALRDQRVKLFMRVPLLLSVLK